MVLDLVFDGFSCISMVYIIQNLKIPNMYSIFENIGQKRAKFCRKWVPKLKISKTEARKLKFGQVIGKKWLEKNVAITFFIFGLILKKWVMYASKLKLKI